MSFGGGNGGYQGGRTRMGTKVYLNLYDLSPANDCLYQVGMGLHHSGVEVLGTEYSFASNAGVFESTPKEAPGAKFREQILMGVMDGGQTELKKALDDVRTNFGPNDYNIIKKNCNHFSSNFIHRMIGKQAPGYVNRIADVGACCSCLLPKQLLENAPVGDPDGNSSSFGSSGGGAYGGPAAPQSNSMRAFTGSGARLGGESNTESEGLMGSLLGKAVGSTTTGSGSGGTSNAKGSDDLTDRREKARRAALARLEKQQQPTQSSASSEEKDK